MSDALPGLPPEGPEALEPRRSRFGLIAGGLAVLAAAGGLAWWFAADTPDAPRNVSAAQVAQSQQPRTERRILASATADESQVRRAYEQFQTVYADLGAPGLASFSQNCAKAVNGDPRILDYCLAFDAYAKSVAADEPWFADADYRHIELAQTALPAGSDAAQRIVDVTRLTRVASGSPPAVSPAEPIVTAEAAPAPVVVAKAASPVVIAKAAPPPAARPVAVAKAEPPLRKSLPTPSKPILVARAEKPAAAPSRAKVQKAAAATKAKPAKLQKVSIPTRKRAADRCRFEPTPAARALCANPSLKAADRRMKQAYEKALAAGADRATLDREQAEWRTARNALASSKDAVARLYDQRIGQLQAHADAPH